MVKDAKITLANPSSSEKPTATGRRSPRYVFAIRDLEIIVETLPVSVSLIGSVSPKPADWAELIEREKRDRKE